MNPRKLVDVLRTIRGKSIDHMPWDSGPSADHIALGKERVGKQDWFPVSPALYKTVKELGARLTNCKAALSKYEAACREYGIKGGR